MMILLLALLVTQGGPSNPGWSFDVRHDHAWGACHGSLTVSESGIRLETSEPDHAREWSWADIQLFEIVSSTEIRIHSYESHGAFGLWRDRQFRIEITGGAALDEALYRFARERSPRPIRTRMVFDAPAGPRPDAGRTLQEIPARHDHALGGCEGTLRIAVDEIAYIAEDPNDSRVWRLDDLASFASTDPFDLRLSTRDETFHFDLKLPLTEAAYAHIWRSVYRPGLQSYRGALR